jgi:hypothetical protein
MRAFVQLGSVNVAPVLWQGDGEKRALSVDFSAQ